MPLPERKLLPPPVMERDGEGTGREAIRSNADLRAREDGLCSSSDLRPPPPAPPLPVGAVREPPLLYGSLPLLPQATGGRVGEGGYSHGRE